ncbi:hypothetical protein ACFPL7_13480 [Dongia soli]|uniref:hypothetical protein n=1 Tax=Dongia soli TaxID=600628 RepID=UPI00361FEF09
MQKAAVDPMVLGRLPGANSLKWDIRLAASQAARPWFLQVSWLMLAELRRAMDDANRNKLSGLVQVDEKDGRENDGSGSRQAAYAARQGRAAKEAQPGFPKG